MKILYRLVLHAVLIISVLGITAGDDIGGLNAAQNNTIYFQDDFEDGVADWALEDGWSLVEEEGNNLLQGTGHKWAWLREGLGAGWSDYAFRFRTKLASETGMHANFYSAEEAGVWHRYFLGFYEEGLSIHRQVGDEFTDLASAGFSVLANQWHTIGVIVDGETIIIRANGEEVITYTDDSPLSHGTIAFESLEGSVLVDDVIVSEYYVPLCGDGICEDEDLTCPEDCQPPEIYWESLGGPVHSGQPQALVQNPANHNELFLILADTRGEIYHSLDRGATWKPFKAMEGKYVSSMAAGQGALFVAGNGVYRYRDGQVEEIGPPGYWAQHLFLHGAFLFLTSLRGSIGEPNMILYADITAEEPVWHDISPNAIELKDLIMPDTQFWAAVQVSGLIRLGNSIIAAIGVLVEGSMDDINGQLYISDDFGNTWAKSSLDIPFGRLITALAQDPSHTEHLVFGLRNAQQEQLSDLSEMLFESADGGRNWLPATTSHEPTFHISDLDFSGGDIYVTLDFGHHFYRLHQGGVEVIEITALPGFPNWNTGMRQIVFDLDDPEVVYGITSWSFGLVKSEDGMQSWQKIEDGIVASSPTIVVSHPSDPNVIYTTGNMIQEKYFTSNFGQNWRPFMPDDPRGDEVRVDVHDPNHLIYMSEGTDLFESRDRGVTFSRIADQFTSAKVFDIEVSFDSKLSPDEFPKIYVSNLGFGISQLTEQDPSFDWYQWQSLRASPDYAYVFTIHPTDGNILYAGQSPRIFENQASIYKYDKNSAGKDTAFGWSKLAAFDGMKGVTALEIHPHNPGTIYAGLTGAPGKLMISTDDGTSWNELNKALTFSTVHAIAVDPYDEDRVFAAPWGGGLFCSKNAGKSWEKLSAPTISIADILFIPHRENHIIIGDRMRPKLYESLDGGKTWETLVEIDEKQYYRVGALGLRGETVYFSLFNRMRGLTAVFLKGPMSGDSFWLNDGKPFKLSGSDDRAILSFDSQESPLYSVTHIDGVHVLKNRQVWQNIAQGLPDMGFNQVLVDELQNIYVAGGCDIDLDGNPRIGDPTIINQIYKSSDGGIHWEPMLNENPFESGIKRLLQHPVNKDVFYVGTGTGVYVSTDRGISWTAQNEGLDFTNIGSMAVTGKYVYAGTLGGGVYSGSIMNDYSIEWLPSTGPMTEVSNIQIVIDPNEPRTIYASSYPGGVFKSTDEGRTWFESNFALPTFEVTDPLTQGYYSLAIDPMDSGTLYLGLYGKGIYKSTDGAGTWFPLYGRMGENKKLMGLGITKVVIDPTNSDIIYAGSDQGVWVSKNAGASWEQMNQGLGTLDIRMLKIAHEGDSSWLFAGTAGYGIYAYRDGSWHHMYNTIGLGWWDTWDRRIYQFGSFRFDPDREGVIYLGHFPGGFFISEDGGLSWKDSSARLGNDGLFSLYVHPSNHNILWAGSYNGVVKSENWGKTWKIKSEGFPSEQWTYTVAFDPKNPDVMYAATKNGQNKGFCDRNEEFCGVVMKSTDGGEQWFEIMDGLDPRSEFYVLLVHPIKNNTLFLSTNKGVYMSKNAGEEWKPINDGLPSIFNQVRDNVAENLAFTSDYKYLILSLVERGVWKAELK